MASASALVDQRNRGNSQKSQFQQTICLVDWWLTKAENGAQGRELAVAGSTSREKQAVRVFSSAPILKRYDVCNLETTDGICVILNGLINKDHTLESGFPSNVCDYFSFGFPPYWKEYHDKFLVEGRQMPSDSHEKDFVSQGKMNAKGIRKSKKVESGKNNTTKAKFDRDSKGVLTRNALNQTDKIIAGKNSLSEKAKAFGVKTKRKLAYETPDGKKKIVPSASPESISISKSRSGRLRMPTLEFWRNQRAVYDADRSITGIEQGIDKQPIIIIPQNKSRQRKQKSTRMSVKKKKKSTRMVHKTYCLAVSRDH